MFPKQIGRFEIKGKIGENERGTVFSAYDPQLQREVAVKLLKTQYLYTMTAERIFKEEAEKIRSLNHPAILPVYDFGDEDNHPFIVTPLMPGGNLSDLIKKNGALPLNQAIEIFTPLADAFDYAASQGVFHLDIKPNNVVFDQHGHPFLADLGLVQIIDALTTAKAPITNSGYISPEQVRGSGFDTRAQVYSLGAMIYETLTGQTLFIGVSEMVTAFKHISERPRPPRSLRPELPEAVDQVLLRAVEKRPEERFQSAGEMMVMLERAQGGVITPEVVMQQRADQFPVAGSAAQPGGGVNVPPTGWTFERDARRPARSANRVPIILGGMIVSGVVCVMLIALGIFFMALPNTPTGERVTPTAISVSQADQETAAAEESAEATKSAALLATEIADRATATVQAQVTSTAQAEATQAAIQATTTAVEIFYTQALAWPSVMNDSFDSNANNWIEDEVNDDEYASILWKIQNGQYVWQVTARQGFVWRVWPDVDPMSGFYVSVDVQQTSGISNAQYGIIFRNSEEPINYYYFEVRESQEWGVYLYDDTEWHTLMPLDFSPAISPGEVNHLEVIGQDDHFLFFINGDFVGEVYDSTLNLGEVGLSIGLSNEGEEAVIVFDNFVVRTP